MPTSHAARVPFQFLTPTADKLGAGPCGPFGVRASALSQPDRFATGASRYRSACASRYKAAGKLTGKSPYVPFNAKKLASNAASPFARRRLKALWQSKERPRDCRISDRIMRPIGRVTRSARPPRHLRQRCLVSPTGKGHLTIRRTVALPFADR